MLSTGNFLLQNDRNSQYDLGISYAGRLFEAARRRAVTGIVLRVLGLRRNMISLSEHLAGRNVLRQHGAGLHTVELDRIRGSESRSKDFDGLFAPLYDHMRERWTKIMHARLNGQPLPAVELLRIGDVYFVRDGHHRISVAHALGTAFIEADVIELEIAQE